MTVHAHIGTPCSHAQMHLLCKLNGSIQRISYFWAFSRTLHRISTDSQFLRDFKTLPVILDRENHKLALDCTVSLRILWNACKTNKHHAMCEKPSTFYFSGTSSLVFILQNFICFVRENTFSDSSFVFLTFVYFAFIFYLLFISTLFIPAKVLWEKSTLFTFVYCLNFNKTFK